MKREAVVEEEARCAQRIEETRRFNVLLKMRQLISVESNERGAGAALGQLLQMESRVERDRLIERQEREQVELNEMRDAALNRLGMEVEQNRSWLSELVQNRV